MSAFRDRVKSKKRRKKKGHKRRATNRAKHGALIEWSWDDIRLPKQNHSADYLKQHKLDPDMERRIIEDEILKTMACPREMVFGKHNKETSTQVQMSHLKKKEKE